MHQCQLHDFGAFFLSLLMEVSKGSLSTGGKKGCAMFETRSGLAFVFDADCDHSHVPWVKRLHADVLPDGNTQITDFFTCRTKTVHGEFAVVELGEDCLLANEDDESQYEPETILEWDVLQDKATGEVSVFTYSEGRHSYICSLDKDFTAHKAGQAHLVVGDCRATIHLAVYVFSKAKPGRQRCFWSLHQLYEALNLSAYRGEPSQWCYRQRPKWRQHFQSTLQWCQLIGGTGSGHGQGGTVADLFHHFFQRCTGHSSVSTCGLLMLLMRFTFQAQQHGGLGEGKKAASGVLQSLLQVVTDTFGSQKALSVIIDEAYHLWPSTGLGLFFLAYRCAFALCVLVARLARVSIGVEEAKLLKFSGGITRGSQSPYYYYVISLQLYLPAFATFHRSFGLAEQRLRGKQHLRARCIRAVTIILASLHFTEPFKLRGGREGGGGHA